MGLETRGQGGKEGTGQGGKEGTGQVGKGRNVWAVERSKGTEEGLQGIGEKVRGNREWEKWSGNGVGG